MPNKEPCSTKTMRNKNKVLSGFCLIAAGLLSAQLSPAGAEAAPPLARAMSAPMTPDLTPMTMATFLDRLMMAESGGRDTVANPRSSAVGAFQFISSTFIEIARKHFPAETGHLGTQALLALRTNRDFARRAAEAYTRDNATHLAAAGLVATWPNLRLAFFAGPDGAVRVLRAKPATPMRAVLGPAIIAANPFLATYTAADMAARASRDLQVASTSTDWLPVDGRRAANRKKTPKIQVLCELSQASCRKWLALAQRRLKVGPAQT
jgi:hypothetical protein